MIILIQLLYACNVTLPKVTANELMAPNMVYYIGGGGGVTHIWDMGYWGVKNLGYGIWGLKIWDMGYGEIIWDMGYRGWDY